MFLHAPLSVVAAPSAPVGTQPVAFGADSDLADAFSMWHGDEVDWATCAAVADCPTEAPTEPEQLLAERMMTHRAYLALATFDSFRAEYQLPSTDAISTGGPESGAIDEFVGSYQNLNL